jgi:hypothetical protein
MIGNLRRQSITDAQTSFGPRQQDDAAISRDPSAIECRDDFLARNGWQCERLRMASGTQFVSTISTLRDTRRRIPAMR